MRGRSWRSYLTTVAALVLQVSVSILGTVGMCVDRPHTHGGFPAPDCLMHHSQPNSTEPDASSHGHHHQHESTPQDARLACSCASDPLTLLTTEIAVMPLGVSIALPDVTAPARHERVQSASDVRLVPLSPPPKHTLA